MRISKKNMTEKQRFLVIGSNSFSGSDFIDLLLDDKQNAVIGVSRSVEKSALFIQYKNRMGAKIQFHVGYPGAILPAVVLLLHHQVHFVDGIKSCTVFGKVKLKRFQQPEEGNTTFVPDGLAH